LIAPRYNPNNKDQPYTVLTAEDVVTVEDFDDPTKLFEFYVLNMLSKIILLEEKRIGRMSGLRLFCRLDVSIFREGETGKHQFFINEITRTHGAGLFHQYMTHDQMDIFVNHLSDVLHLVSSQKLYLCPPTLP
jgi:hypothetical protein